MAADLTATGTAVFILCGIIIFLIGLWLWMHWNTPEKEMQIWADSEIRESIRGHFKAENRERK